MTDHLALDHHMLQDPEEFGAFCKLLESERVRSYLEIGSWSGGSIEMVAKHMPHGSRIVSVDLPVVMSKHEKLKQVLIDLQGHGFLTYLHSGDSIDPRSIFIANKLGPYDAVFIDGAHAYEYVLHDWTHYGQMGRIVGFHDIAIDKPPHGVARLWRELKPHFRHVEFISEETRRQDEGYGIGVIFRDEQ